MNNLYNRKDDQRENLIKRLHRLNGQLNALARIYEQEADRPIDEIINLLDAVISGLDKVKLLLIKFDIEDKLIESISNSLEFLKR